MGHKALSPWNHGGGGGSGGGGGGGGDDGGGGGCGGGGLIARHIELIQYHHYRHTLWKKMITVEVSCRGYVIATLSMYSTYDKWILRIPSKM